MSGIAGIIHFDGKPVEPGLIQKMTSAMAHRGPDGINHWVKGSVAIGHCVLRTTPESLEERQPLANEDGSLVLVMDGRVDSWEELRRELLARRVVLRNRSDAELVLRSYEIWGRECLAHIDGDFALVIWDAQRREAFCARDRLGIKPLNYHWRGNVLSFASELQSLLQLPWVARALNTGMISEYLADSLISRDETFFQDCFRLPGATTLTFGSSRKSPDNYWAPSDVRGLHLGAKDDYVECFGDLLAKATTRRIRTISKVGVLLSGGVDSSSVACFAQSEMPADVSVNLGIETFSLVFPGMACDEDQMIEAFLYKIGLGGHKLAANQPNLEGWKQNLDLFKDVPDSPTGAAYYPLLNLASERGCRVLLGGWGSDDWIGGGTGIYEDVVSCGGFRAIKNRLVQDIQRRGIGDALRLMLGSGVRPALRRLVLAAIGLRQLPFRGGRAAPPLWLGAVMAQAFRARRTRAAAIASHKTASHHKAGILRWLNSGMFALNAELQERSCAWHGIEGRYPFHDRSIIEFAFALPDRVKWSLARPKELLIEATRRRFAPLSEHRFSDPEGSPIYLNAVRSEQCSAKVESNLIGAIGWIEPGECSALYRNVLRWFDQGDDRYALHVRSLWQIIALDSWYQHVINQENSNARQANLGKSETATQVQYT